MRVCAAGLGAIGGLFAGRLGAMNGVPWWFFDGLRGLCAGLVVGRPAGGTNAHLQPVAALLAKEPGLYRPTPSA